MILGKNLPLRSNYIFPKKHMMNKDELFKDIISNYFGTVNEVIKRFNICDICGMQFHFCYTTDFKNNLTYEVVNCNDCGKRKKRIIHNLN